MISSLFIGRQNNDLGEIRVREFWIVRKEKARSTRPSVSRNNLGFGLQPQPVLYFFRTRGGGFYAGALWQSHLYQEFRPIGLRKNCFLTSPMPATETRKVPRTMQATKTFRRTAQTIRRRSFSYPGVA